MLGEAALKSKELADGDLPCLCIEKLRIELGLEEISPARSSFGVCAPIDRRPAIAEGESRTTICTEVIDDLLELTLLDRREETEGLCARLVPLPLCTAPLVLVLLFIVAVGYA